MHSRRKFLTQTGAVAAGALGTSAVASGSSVTDFAAWKTESLCGQWWFRTDPGNVGQQEGWQEAESSASGWRTVRVPHTWQIESDLVDYRSVAWYRRTLDVPLDWQSSAVRVEFEAVFHTAKIWVNRQLAGEHVRKGYTAFVLEISHLLRYGAPNTIAVRVDSDFNKNMVPRGRSSDWAHDGGIYRPVQLLVTPKTFIERVDIEALPDLSSGDGKLTITAHLQNTNTKPWLGRAAFRVVDPETGLTVLTGPSSPAFTINSGATQTQQFEATLPSAKLWHFDHPHLYQLLCSITSGTATHQLATAFGVRKLEARDNNLLLNGEKVRLMGVERMPGSNPDFGMAEPAELIARDHDELKRLNCVFTRVHWPQDKRVLDYCDQHGILMQTEVPAWGPDTFAGMKNEPDADLLQNGLEQLREMIARDRNHPSLVIWGLCNEIHGQNSPAYQFAKTLLKEAKSLDPNRLCAYASDSLRETPERDVAGLMDIIETNEYFGTWYPGSAKSLSEHLDSLHAAFPGKPVVISEYGYCACADDRPEGDAHRIEILRSHNTAMRSKDFVAGAIFFCYNDYRTHVGDRGVGALTQRVHGVVDLWGAQKPSYKILRHEASPVESLAVENRLNAFRIRLTTWQSIPAYTLRGYKLTAARYGQGNIPVERREIDLPDVASGTETSVDLTFTQSAAPLHIKFDVFRPTGFSAYTLDWKP